MKILCLGDSLTYGYGVRREDTWCATASRLTGHDFINRGVNGALTGEMLEQELFGDELFIMGGLNDLFMGLPLSVPLKHLHSICVRARAAGIRPTLGIPMQISSDVSEAWCDGPVDIDYVRKAYAEFSEELLRFGRQNDIRTIDFRPVVGPAELSFDGIHPNARGHLRMAEAVAAVWKR